MIPTPTNQYRSYARTLIFKMAAAAILEFEVKMVYKHTNDHLIIFVMPDLGEIATSISSFGRLVQDTDLTLIFKMAAAAILDFEVKMALIYKVSYPIVFLTPKLVGIDT